IITVGASDDGDYVDFGGERIRNYSSRGPTKACIMKPDIVAPGSNIVSCNYRFLQGKEKSMYAVKSGTSMATPIVSGTIALLLQKYPDMTPREIKIRIKNRARDNGMERMHQGWGILDIKKLLE
ncbi:MAG: S8 family serine peptidase, partial [Acetivibrio sp.]